MNYSKFEQQDLIRNHNCFTEEWDLNRLFRDITQREQNLQEIVTDANGPINYQNIFNAIYTIFFNTGFFYNNWGDWNNKTSTQKTRTKFQAHFVKAQGEIRQNHKSSTKQSIFHSANAVMQYNI